MSRLSSKINFDAVDANWNAEPTPAELFQSIDVAIYTTDADGWLTYYNDAAAALWGFRPVLSKARWSGAWRMYRPDGSLLSHPDCPLATALKTHRIVRATEVLLETPDGDDVRVMTRPALLRDAAGTVTGAFDVLQRCARPLGRNLRMDYRAGPSLAIRSLSAAGP